MVQLAWTLMNCAPIAVPKRQLVDRYRDQLRRRVCCDLDDRTWEPQLRLVLLGQTLRVMGFILWAAKYRPRTTCTATCGSMNPPSWCE